jgi:hypothetical protein
MWLSNTNYTKVISSQFRKEKNQGKVVIKVYYKELTQKRKSKCLNKALSIRKSQEP